MKDNYQWEAQSTNGDIIKVGGNLDDVIKISFIPAEGTSLPQHDIVGVKMKRRFGRAFINAIGNGPAGKRMKEYIHCVVCEGFRLYIKSSDGVILITPEDYEYYI